MLAMKFKYILLFFFLLPFAGTLDAQNVEYGVMVDTNYMLVGDQQHLTFVVRGEPGLNVRFPQLKDSVVSGVEIISGPVRDSLRDADGRWRYEAKYVVTAFDTGVYIIPPMPITVEGEEYNNVLRTDPVAFVVNTYQVDLQQGYHDIVMPYDAPWVFAEILPFLPWILLGLAILGIAWWLWQRYRKNKPLFESKKEEIPPYVIAIRSLDEIKETKLWQAGREKEYYTRLTDTVRLYLDNELGIPAMEQTSGETLQSLEQCPKVDYGEREKMADLLSTADFVKFAKHTPLQSENARYLDSAYDFIHTAHQRVQDEQAEAERRRKEEEKALAEAESQQERDKEVH